MIGAEKGLVEPNWLKRWGYFLLGEIHIPGRIRLNHTVKGLGKLKFEQSDKVCVLDAGSGKGDIAFYLARRFPKWQVVAIELETEKVEKLRSVKEKLALENLKVVQKDLVELDYKDKFHLIICSDVMEHIEEDDLVFRNLTNALKSSGYLLIHTPAITEKRNWLWKKRTEILGVKPSDYGHVREGYFKEDLTERLTSNGIKHLDFRWTFGPMGLLAHDIFVLIGDNRPNPLIFLLFLPFLLLLGFLDVNIGCRSGGGLLVLTRK